MITWRCSAAALLLLGACDVVEGPSLAPAGAVQEVTLAGGAVALRAPEGYCVDRGALTAQFAAIARCDTMGGSPAAGPLALITVSVARMAEASAALVGVDPGAGEVIQRRTEGNLDLVQVRGAPVDAGFDALHWRGLGPVGAYSIGLALYAPEGGPAAGDAGADLLTTVIAGISNADSTAAAPPPARENPVAGWINGLFN
ncbi:MAG: hypothetical protein AAF218_07295 [Pseudomonadota bacterium]